MQTIKNKTIAIIFALLMVTSTAGVFFNTQTANAHSTGPVWNIPSTAYLVATPDPIGVDQTGAIMMWVDYPLPSAVVTNDIRRHNYTLTITAPSGHVDTQHWDAISDTTGIQYYRYTPTEIGTYMLDFKYGGQTYTWSGTYANDTYSPASRSVNWTVQQDLIPNPVSSFPLPAEYWTHPIEGQNTDWWAISSNWLGSPYIVNRFQPYGLAPNSAHVMWSKAIQEGGVVGGMMGPSTDEPVKTFYMGGSYNVRWANPLIMNGKLYYELPYGNSGSGGGYVCNDLRTGEELWRVNTTATGSSIVPNFGYLYSFDDGNQHGVLPNGLLFTSNFARAIDPDTGVLTTLNITNVPTGTAVVGLKGEVLRYTITNCGNSTNPKWYLAEWNSTTLFSSASSLGPSAWYSGNLVGNTPFNYSSLGTNTNWNGTTWVNSTVRAQQGYAAMAQPAYDWNISLTDQNAIFNNGLSWTINSYSKYGYGAILTQGNFGGRQDTYYGGNWYGANVTYISLKPDNTMGKVQWTKFFPAAENNVTRNLVAIDHDSGVFIFEDQETLVHWGYSLADGSKLWGPTPPVDQFDYFRSTTRAAYGNFYFAGYGGILYCFDVKTGNLKWTYGNGGPGNSTSSGLTTAWGHYPLFMPAIADGKVFLDTTEHSPDSPYYKGAQVRAVNATDGKEIWTLDGWGTGMDANYDIAADGYFAYLNSYDEKVYVIGKGPSETSVNIQNNVLQQGSKVLIEGSVLDIATGTTQDEQIARFPDGVPAVADKSQTGWMEYVYMQKPRPTDTVGVDVSFTVVDPNGNVRTVGSTTTDQSGKYSYLWQPDVPGKYTVIATFGGTESYWPSYSEASFGVTEAAPTPSPYPVVNLPPTEMYVLGTGVAIIIALAIATLLILRKRP
ncbi:MAG TPA: PQQ-binding-like beta-propeller repeat protein [Candidatus Bathyarchaeia archaeon]